ncbi:MAG: hypothetical protein KF847_20185 [Pirellulales bacterium]|nr:hypothetical protein [Pirellulales bacterium]
MANIAFIRRARRLVSVDVNITGKKPHTRVGNRKIDAARGVQKIAPPRPAENLGLKSLPTTPKAPFQLSPTNDQ